MMKRAVMALICLIGTLLSAVGNDTITVVRPVTAAYTISVGEGRLVDTYLSPLKYDGPALSIDYERRQAMKFDPEKWTMRLAGRLEAMYTQNTPRNTELWDLELHLDWGMTRRFSLPYNITLAGGGSTSLDLGCLYNRANGNNPVSAKAAWTVNLTGYGAWRTHIKQLPVTVTYQPTIPLVGAFFSPDYGELYYEIYMGDHKGLAHCAWWGNYRAMEHLLTADFHFGATALRVGFRSNFLSTRVNNINTRIISNSVVIGVSGEWMSLNPRKTLSPTAKFISGL